MEFSADDSLLLQYYRKIGILNEILKKVKIINRPNDTLFCLCLSGRLFSIILFRNPINCFMFAIELHLVSIFVVVRLILVCIFFVHQTIILFVASLSNHSPPTLVCSFAKSGFSCWCRFFYFSVLVASSTCAHVRCAQFAVCCRCVRCELYEWCRESGFRIVG